MKSVQKAARALALANLGIGITGFTGPLVRGNRDRVINMRPGLLFGVFAMNWTHALAHLAVGAAGLPAARNPQRSLRYMQVHAGLFGALAAWSWPKVVGPQRIVHVMGMAVDGPSSVVHTVWAATGLWYSRDGQAPERHERLAVTQTEI